MNGNLIEGEINKVIYLKKTVNSNYYFKTRLNNFKLYTGFSSHIPLDNDLISGFINKQKTLKKNIEFNDDNIEINKVHLKLPENKEHQMNRIIKIVNENEVNFNENETRNFYSKFNHGKFFWFDIMEHYWKLEELEECEFPHQIVKVCEHIQLYLDNMILVFKNKLLEFNIKLNNKQIVSLYIHPDFGFIVSSWKINSLHKLFNISGFGFKTVIKIALGLKATVDDITKIIILYCIMYNHNGNTFLVYDFKRWKREISSDPEIREFYESTDEFFNNLTEEKFETIIKDLYNEGTIININNYIYAKKIYETEMNIARLLNLIKNKSSIQSKIRIKTNKLINTIASTEFIKDDGNKECLNSEQQKGIIQIFQNNVSITYGKAGTGKSSMLQGLMDNINLLNKLNCKLYLLAPTGKARMKLKDILSKYDHNKYDIEVVSSTIHGFNNKHNPDNKYYKELEKDCHYVFIIDESSMIDIKLLYEFLTIIYDLDCSISFLGDIRQLPSIGPGCILDKLISCNVFSSNELIRITRNDDVIIKILDKVINGEEINQDDCDQKKKFVYLEINKDEEKNTLLNLSDNSDMIICTNNDFIDNLTNEIREIKNPYSATDLEKKETYQLVNKIKNNKIEETKIIYRIGDPVMHCKNNNKLNLVNGMTGKVVDIFFSDKNDKVNKYDKVSVQYTSNKVSFIVDYDVKSDLIKDLKPAYLITAHKSQGQEYKNITVVLKNSRLLNRNILYTMLSRAKEKITLISTKENLDKCLSRKIKRNSLLDFMFKYYNEQSKLTFEKYMDSYFNQIDEENDESNNIEIIINGENFILQKTTNYVYNNGSLFGKYNPITNKVKKFKPNIELNL